MAGLGRPWIAWACAALCAGWLGILCSPVSAQLGFPFQQRMELTPEQSLLDRLPKEPLFLSEMNTARELLSAGEIESAIDVLQPLLESGEDYFEIVDGKPGGSLLERIENMLWEMPPEAIETYRQRYELTAGKRVKSAVARGDQSELLAISRTYPLTLAAQSALEAAGELAFDQGETALAARLWERTLPRLDTGPARTERLLRIAQAWTLAGQPDVASGHVQELSTLTQTSPIEFEGKLLTPPSSGDPAWLVKIFGPVIPLVPQRSGDWSQAGGHPRRWGAGPQTSTVQRGSWSYPLVDQYDVFGEPGRDGLFQTFLRDLEQKYQRVDPAETSRVMPLVIGAPLLVGDTVLIQGIGSVKALDARTGQLRWSGVVRDETFLYWAWRNFEAKDLNPSHDRLVEIFLGQRSWVNQTGAALSSDGQLVYAVSGTGMVGAYSRNMFQRNGAQPPPSELMPPSDNRLLAYEISTGLLRWESGGPSVAVQLDQNGERSGEARKLGGAFFLGAPLPVDGQVFVLAEDRGQVRLFSLSPETGEAEWSLPLLNPDNGIAFDETRRMFGLSPAYAGGLLICPTGEGVVVAVDPLLRRVRWIQQYQQPSPTQDPRALAMMRFQRQRLNSDSHLQTMVRQRRWIDNTPVLTAGRAVLPAAESNQLLCIEMETGKMLWDLPRGDGLFIAACTERLCLVAGERSLQAIRLSDGKVAWNREIPTPSGRGVVSGGQYLLPVSTNEILSIDMKSGRVLSRAGIDPQLRAGSLISARGQLLMQTTSQVVGWRPLSEITTEIARDLNTPETRAQALAEQGQLLLSQGKDQEAVAMLQESLQLEDSPPVRRLLVWSLLDRIRTDYAGSRALAAELKQTVIDLDQKTMLNRLNAEGLEKAGEPLAAFREYLELAREIGRNDALVEVSFDHQVREDRWLRGRLTQLYQQVDAPLRQQMQAAMQQVVATQDPAIKPQIASVLGIDLAPQLHLDLAMENRPDQFVAQRILWTLSESPNLELRGPAVARLIRNELSQKRSTFVGPLISRLNRDLADVECEPGLTGRQLLEKFHSDSLFSPQLAAITRTDTLPAFAENRAGGALQQRDVFPVLGTRRGPFADWNFTLETNPGQTAQCCDSSGRTRHTLNLDALGDRNLRPVRYVQTDPQLVLLAFRDRFAVISPMDAGGNQFQTRFMATLAENPGYRDRQIREPEIKTGVRDLIYPTVDNSYYGNIGPLTYDTLCYQSGDELFAVIPHLKDRKILWKRSGIPAGSEICADSEYVILFPPLQSRMIVLRAADGSLLSEKDLPQGLVNRKRAEWGRLLLVEREVPAEGAQPAGKMWAMMDPALDREVWNLKFPANTRWAPVDGADLAFLEPGGTMHLVDDQTGQETWKAQLPAETVAPRDFYVLTDRDRVFVHTAHEKAAGQEEITEYASPANGSAVRVNGQVVALNRKDGQQLWVRSMEQQLLRPFIPPGSGVLAYAAQRRRVKSDNKEETYTQLTFLDRATGAPVVTKDASRIGTGEGWARPSNGVMLLRVSGQDYRLTWKVDADSNTAPGVPDQAEPEPEGPIKMQ